LTRFALIGAVVMAIALAVWLAVAGDSDLQSPGPEAGSSIGSAPARTDEPADTTASPDGVNEDTRQATTPGAAPSDQPVFDAYQFTSFQQLLDSLGIDRDYAAWERARGEPYPGDPQLFHAALEGYEEMTEASLRELADQGDVVALTVLSNRIREERPLESLDLWRQEADDGSAYAIGQMATELRLMAQAQSAGAAPPWDETQQAGIRSIGEDADALRAEAMAWTLLDEVYRGQPRGSLVTPLFGHEPGTLPVELGTACARAAELHGQLEMAWQARETGAPPSGAPPIGHDSPEPRKDFLEACPVDVLPTPDLSGCRTFSMSIQDWGSPMEWQMYACPEEPGNR